MRKGFHSIKIRLRVGFLALISLTLCLGGFALFKMHELAALTELLYEHPLTVGYANREIRSGVLETAWLLDSLHSDSSTANLDKVERTVRELDIKILANFDVVMERFLGDKKDIRIAQSAYLAWKPMVAEQLQHGRQRMDRTLTNEQEMRFDAALVDLLSKCQVMTDFALNKARSFYTQSHEEKTEAFVLMLVLILVILLVSAVWAEVTARGITGPLGAIVKAMKLIASGEFRERMEIVRRDEVGHLADSFREMQASLQDKTALAEAIAQGDYSREIVLSGEFDRLGLAVQRMTVALRAADDANKRSDWLKTGQNECNKRIAGVDDVQVLAQKALAFFAEYLHIAVGAFYTMADNATLTLTGGYAFQKRKSLADTFALGQGLVGQAAFEKDLISISDVPEGYCRVTSALGDAAPRNIVAVPLVYEGKVTGVLELGSFLEFPDDALLLLGTLAQDLAVSLQTIQNQAKLQELLEASRIESLKLQEQQEELRAANEELEEQTKILRHSEEQLRVQQEELEATNEELEEKTNFLERQRELIAQKNQALESTQTELERKAQELEQASQYKSDFLSNMSHELRTPLNSILILARNLGDNFKGNLLQDQVEAARIIHQSGNSLLSLINDILDLSKIEAGKMTLNVENVALDEVDNALNELFKPAAEAKGLVLECSRDSGLPASLLTDRNRLDQILKNLVGNSIKFTERGAVSLRIHRPDWATAVQDLAALGLTPATAIAFTVADTGIGIPPEKQREIFEAFLQADGSTTRKYGGTGLGLAISRELAKLLGGEIRLASEPEQGATFTLYLAEAGPAESSGRPTSYDVARPSPGPAAPRLREQHPLVTTLPLPPPVAAIADDRDAVKTLDHAILIVEDDAVFAKILLDLCRTRGFKALAATSGEEGLELARRYLPAAMILDIKLPGITGWEVLKRLKADPATRHIPVHVMSGLDAAVEAMQRGAIGFLSKPTTPEDLDEALGHIGTMIDKKVKDLLVVEDDPGLRKAIIDLLADGDVAVEEAATGSQALEAIGRKHFDCMVLDLGLPDMSGFDLLHRLETEFKVPIPPVIVYTGKDLTREEEMELRRYSAAIIVKSARSEDRLLDEATLFLHRMVSNLPDKKQRMLARLQDRDVLFKGKKVLAVDDDMRNLFAVAHILEDKGVEVIKAENGQRALDMLEQHHDVDLVLLDIMMPVMDGYQTLKRLRANPRLSRLPVIALTAKAMREDRDKCLAAGASDYLAKPLDVDRFLSMLRVWLCS